LKVLKKRPPYDFVLEDLADIVTAIKPMFGAFGIYKDDQILMILRKKEKFDQDTGLWLAIPDEHVLSLKKTIPELRDLQMFGTSPTAWQVVGEEIENFEEICLKICEMIRKRDARIGRTPKKRLRKSKTKSKKKTKKIIQRKK
jgi:hypothetical protein